MTITSTQPANQPPSGVSETSPDTNPNSASGTTTTTDASAQDEDLDRVAWKAWEAPPRWLNTFFLGAPGISLPTLGCSPEIFQEFAEAFNISIVEKTNDAAKESLKTSDRKKQELIATKKADNEKWMALCAEAKAKSDAMPAWAKTFLKVFLGVVMAVVSVATLGSAAPAMTALAVVAAALMFADAASKERGGPDISLSNGLTQGFTALLQACDKNMTTEEAQKHAGLLTGLFALTPMVLIDPSVAGAGVGSVAMEFGLGADDAAIVNAAVTVVAGLMVMYAMPRVSGLTKSAEIGERTAMATKVGTGLLAGAQISRSATDIESSYSYVETKELERDAAKAKKKVDDSEVALMDLQQMDEETFRKLKSIFEQFDALMASVGVNLEANAQCLQDMWAKFGAPRG